MSTFNLKESIKQNPKALKRIYEENKLIIESSISFKSDIYQEYLYCYINDKVERPKCICGLDRKFHKYSKGYHSTCGDPSCKRKTKTEKTKKTNIKKYGSECVFSNENIKEKIRETNIKKYGHSNPMSNLSVQTKHKSSMLNRHGVEHPLQNKEFVIQRRKSMIDRFGTHSWFNTSDFKNCMIDRYGNEQPMRNQLIRDRVANTQAKNKLEFLRKKCSHHNKEIIGIDDTGRIMFVCNNCDSASSINRVILNSYLRSKIDFCRICNPINRYRSKLENEILQFIRGSYTGSIDSNMKIGKYELDVFIKELNFGIEFNGLYWHSEEYKEKNYHSDKHDYFKSLGISVLNIWEDDWFHKNDIVRSIINVKLKRTKKIYARKCQVKKLTNGDFFKENHLDSNARGAKYIYALEYEGDIVCAISLGKSRYSNHDYEIFRFASKINTNVIGGFSKLLKWIVNKHHIKSIITYRKRDHGTSTFYENVGFQKIKTTSPNYYWIVDGIRMNRQNFMRTKLKGIREKQTEIEYMHERGYFRIWDCGSDVYFYEVLEDI